MKTSDFFYDLPEELIAQTPIEPRNMSRLMVLSKETGEISHNHFYDLPKFLKKGDCLVLNDTRVLPARLYGTREDTGAVVEFVLLRQRGNMLWECLAGPGKKAKTGTSFRFSEELTAEVTEVKEDGNRMLLFSCDGDFISVHCVFIAGKSRYKHYKRAFGKMKIGYKSVHTAEFKAGINENIGVFRA